MTSLVLLKTHNLGRQAEAAFSRLDSFCPGASVRMLLDTTAEELRSARPALRFNASRLEAIGLALFPPSGWAWFSGDYALYPVFLDEPDHDYYVMVEYDVWVNFRVDQLIGKARDGRLDFIAGYAGFERDSWMWTAASRLWFDRPAGSFFPFVVMSRRLVSKCLEYRLRQSHMVPADPDERDAFLRSRWVHCEAFVPSVARQEGYRITPIHQLVPGWTYDYFRDVDAILWDMPALGTTPCAHPVFIEEELPHRLKARLAQLPEGDLRRWLIDRARSLRDADPHAWNRLCAINPELG